VLVALITACFAGGCATNKILDQARIAEQQQDYDRAVLEYGKLVKLHPDDRNLRLALDRSKLRAAEDHYNRGRRLASAGKYEPALIELQLASELSPTNGDIDAALRQTRAAFKNRIAVSREGKTQLETIIDHAREMPSPGFDLPRDIKLPASVVFSEASSKKVLTALGRLANINVIFDPAFRDQPVTIDLHNMTFEDALSSVTTSTHNFYRVTAPRTVTIAPDTAAKRREYEEEIVRTFYLSNADLKETIDLLRIVIDARRIAGVPATNAITIKDSPDRIAAASRVITAIDKARPEVVIDVELLEVDRTRLQEYGLQIATPVASGDPTGINGAIAVNKDPFTLRDLRSLTSADVILTGFPTLFYRLLKSDTNTRTLANPQLRTSEGMPAQARFGERVPVPVTTFAPIASGGVPQQPITSFNYENIGVNIDITPRTHHNDDVSLALKVEVSSISGTGYGGLPTFGNRSINTVIRLKDGETNIMAGLIRDDERRVLNGIPGLSDLPLVGHLFAQNRKETQQTDIILTLTPHIVRVLDLNESDLRPFQIGRDTVTPPIELPTEPVRDQPAATPPVDQPATPPQRQEPQPVGPVLPPDQSTPTPGQQPPPSTTERPPEERRP
jgi:general secretion pathway protein D